MAVLPLKHDEILCCRLPVVSPPKDLHPFETNHYRNEFDAGGRVNTITLIIFLVLCYRIAYVNEHLDLRREA